LSQGIYRCSIEIRENGGRVAPFSRLSWEVRGAAEKPLLHLWSENYNFTRRVLVFAHAGSEHGILDLLTVTRSGRLAILELKAANTFIFHCRPPAIGFAFEVIWSSAIFLAMAIFLGSNCKPLRLMCISSLPRFVSIPRRTPFCVIYHPNWRPRAWGWRKPGAGACVSSCGNRPVRL
jgi:hypothetical protein